MGDSILHTPYIEVIKIMSKCLFISISVCSLRQYFIVFHTDSFIWSDKFNTSQISKILLADTCKTLLRNDYTQSSLIYYEVIIVNKGLLSTQANLFIIFISSSLK